MNTFQLARFGYIVESVDIYNKGVVDELGGFRNDIATFGRDISEVRSLLYLPVKEYSFAEDTPAETEKDTKQTSETEKAVYAAISGIVEEQKLERIAADAEKNTAELYNTLKEDELKLGELQNTPEAMSFRILDENAQPLFNVINGKTEEKLIIQSALGSYEVKAKDSSGIKKEILSFTESNKEKVLKAKTLIEQTKAEITELFGQLAARSDTLAQGMKFSDPRETETAIEYYVLNGEDEELLTFEVNRGDGKITLNGTAYDGVKNFKPAFEEALKGVDASTSSDKYINERKAELEAVFAEEAFKEFLKANALALAPPREEYNKIVYDLKDASGGTIFGFVLELSSGQFKILRNNEETDLLRTLEDGSKKNF